MTIASGRDTRSDSSSTATTALASTSTSTACSGRRVTWPRGSSSTSTPASRSSCWACRASTSPTCAAWRTRGRRFCAADRLPRDERVSLLAGPRERRPSRALGPAGAPPRWLVLGLSALSLCASLWVIHVGGRLHPPEIPADTESGRARRLLEKELPGQPPSFSL